MKNITKKRMLRIPRRQTAMPKIAAFCKLASCSLAASTLPLSAVSLPASSSSFSLQKPPLIAFVHSCVSRRGRKHFALSSKSSIVSLGFSGLSVTRGHCSTPQFPFGEVMDLHTDYSVMRMSHTTSSDIRNDSEITVEGMDGERAISTNQILDGDNHLLNSNSGDEIMFDEQQISSFEDALEVILLKRNVIRDFKKNEKDLDIVKQHLIDRKRKLPRWDIQQFLQSPQPNPSNATDNYNGTVREDLVPYTKQKLRERRQMYLDNTGLTVPQHRLATVLLAHLSDHCAKTSNPQPLYVGWEKLLEAGMTPLERTLSTSMYVFSLDEDADAAGNGRDVASEVAMFHDALYEPTEKTIALLVKSLVSRGDAAGAENLLDGIVDGSMGDLRHRTTSPILKLYCAKGQIDSALRLYHRMKHTSRVVMEAATYADFIASVAANGFFRPDSKPIDGAQDLGYKPAFGPGLLDTLITDMSEDVLDISEDSAGVLQTGFATGFEECELDALSPTETLKPTTTLCEGGKLVANRVAVDHDTGKCPATNATLRLIVLEDKERVHVHDTLLVMAKEKSKAYTAKLVARGRTLYDNAVQAEQATQILTEFSEWLDTREGEPFTAIVDGANIAYFGWGRVNVYQLTLMVNALEKQGEHPLVIMPQKYTRRKFHLRQGVMQYLKDEELALYKSLKEKGQLYVVAPMCHDDMYWMLASVSNQTVSTNGQSIHVPKNNDEGRFPGLRPMVISNDKMRDHKLDLLEERSFRRWCCSHVVNYNFTEYIENNMEDREITFQNADIFSDEIQGNACPDGGIAWHFPVREWGANDRFCLRLPA